MADRRRVVSIDDAQDLPGGQLRIAISDCTVKNKHAPDANDADAGDASGADKVAVAGEQRRYLRSIDVEDGSTSPSGACDPERDWRPQGPPLI